MEVTPLGVFWIVIGAIALFKRDGIALLSLLAVASIFQASMVMSVNFSGQADPILPYYWIAILIALRVGWLVVSGRIIRLPPGARTAMLLLVALAVVATAVTLTAPWVFIGLPVYDPQRGIDSQYLNLGALEFQFSMVGQLGYLWLNVVVVWYAAMEGARKDVASRFVRALVWAGAAAVMLALWQFAAWKLGLPYPYEHLNNAVGWSPGYIQYLAGVKRINGSFTEPSSMAAFMLGFFAFMMVLWLQRRDPGTGVLVALSLISLVISTSTTAYLGLLALLLIWLLTAAIRQTGLSQRGLAALLIAGILIAVLLPAVMADETARQVFDSSVLSKRTSSSFVHRTAADLRSLELLIETGGLGVGLGGNRPSSFIASVASNLGVVGFALFAFFLVAVWHAAAVRAKNALGPSRIAAAAASWGLLGSFIGKQISQPDLSQPTLWIWLVMLMLLATSPHKEVVRS